MPGRSHFIRGAHGASCNQEKKKKKDSEDVRSRQTELEAEGRHYSPFPLSEEMSFKSESMECYANSIVTKCGAGPALDQRRSIARGCGESGGGGSKKSLSYFSDNLSVRSAAAAELPARVGTNRQAGEAPMRDGGMCLSGELCKRGG